VAVDAGTLFDASVGWRLNPDVSLRGESFGALAYHHGTRRLVFLKSPTLVTLVSRLGEFASAQLALEALVDAPARESYERALGSLAAGGVIRAA
jgi:mycofactocin biosynthesis protein MftB